MAKDKKKKAKASEQLAKSIDKFLKERETNRNNRELFDKAIKKAVKRDSK